MGQLAYAFFGWCGPKGYVPAGIFLVVWTVSTLFMYYNTQEYQLLGILLAAFGVIGVLRGCSDEWGTTGGSYSLVVSIVVCLCIKCIVDSLCAKGRADAEAILQLRNAWSAYKDTVSDFLNPEVKTVTFRADQIWNMFKDAAVVSNKDAAAEPRLWKAPWKADLYTQVCDYGREMCEALSIMESASSKTGVDGGEKS